MQAIDKLVPDEEECAQLRSELSKYISQHGVFASLHANKDRDRLNPIEWWNMYGSSCTVLHKWAIKVLSQVVNSSSAERCWSTYSYIHNVKRNSLNDSRAESLVFVHYNLRLLTHYCDAAKSNRSFVTWDNNPEEANLEEGAIALEHLEVELLGDDDDANAASEIQSALPPPSSSSRFQGASSLPHTSQPPAASSRGGRVASRAPLPPARLVPPSQDEEAPVVHRSREKKLEVSRGKRKY